MALRRLCFGTLFALFSVLLANALASSDYGYGVRPEFHKPKSSPKEKLLPMGIQGLILCQSGSKVFPIKGAVARITCLAVDENGYEAAPFSILSKATDSKGYFLATLSPDQLRHKPMNLRQCKAFLESSPLETCKVRTDENRGLSGALLSSYRLLPNKMKLYSVPPFFCTSETKTIPNGY